MCVPIFSQNGVRLRRLSREDIPEKTWVMLPSFCKNQWLPIIEIYWGIFSTNKGVQVMRNEQRSPILSEVGGGGVRSDRNLDNNSESCEKHFASRSPLIECSYNWLLCFGAILQFFIFDPCHMFNEVLIRRTWNRENLSSKAPLFFQRSKNRVTDFLSYSIECL